MLLEPMIFKGIHVITHIGRKEVKRKHEKEP